MNKEKIDQLSKQAIEQVNKEHTKLGPDFWIEIYNQKFAELIVRECADYIDAFNQENMVEEGIGGTELKQHFEVE
jgi:hypothetical protein